MDDGISSDDRSSLISTWKNKDGSELHLDLRAFIGTGGEPYAIIMRHLADVKGSDILVVHAPFEPKPLEMQAKQMGFVTRLYREGVDHYCLEFKMPLNTLGS